MTKSYRYDAFGNEKNPADADVNPFRYCGEYFDKETGSIYLRARYYVPGLGRFTTQDPIRDGLNWYTYCGGNPIRFKDPTGLLYRPDDYDRERKKGVADSVFAPGATTGAETPAATNPRTPADTLTGQNMGLPSQVTGEIKRYEDYTMLNSTVSYQYQLQQMAYTDSLGFRRINVPGLPEPAYMAALGSYYIDENTKGVSFEITLSNGTIFYLIAGDLKADKDTNPDTHQYTFAPGYGITEENADIIEFIMDIKNPIAKQLLQMGVLNHVNEYEFMHGEITSIIKLDIPTIIK